MNPTLRGHEFLFIGAALKEGLNQTVSQTGHRNFEVSFKNHSSDCSSMASSFMDLSSKHYAHFTVSGYIRQSYNGTMPEDVIRLILLFIDLSIHWCLNSAQISDAFSMKVIPKLYQDHIYNFRGLIFKANVQIQDSNLIHFIELTNIPKDIIERFHICLKFSNPQANLTKVRYYVYPHSDKHSYIRKITTRNFRKFDHLCFILNIDASYIIYKSVKHKPYQNYM